MATANTAQGTQAPPQAAPAQQTSQQPQQAPSSHVDRVSVKPPPFWKTETNLWFIQLEAIANITNNITKYNYVISAIHTEIF